MVLDKPPTEHAESPSHRLQQQQHQQQQLPMPITMMMLAGGHGGVNNGGGVGGVDDSGEVPGSLAGGPISLPAEMELVLLCLDYLRDLRRAYPPHVLRAMEGIDPNALTVACWALSHSLVGLQPYSRDGSNDAFFDPNKAGISHSNTTTTTNPFLSLAASGSAGALALPSLKAMELELLYMENPLIDEDQQKQDDDDDDEQDGDGVGTEGGSRYHWYEYDDSHPCNAFRYYPLSGLAGGPSLRGPLGLGEICAAGLVGLGARSRHDAEEDMVQSPLFEQFLHAVRNKGFFDQHHHNNNHRAITPSSQHPPDEYDDEFEGGGDDHQQQLQQAMYQERYQKVVTKFRSKLASKIDTDSAGAALGDFLALSAAEQYRQQRALRVAEGPAATAAAVAAGAAAQQEHSNNRILSQQEADDIRSDIRSRVPGSPAPPGYQQKMRFFSKLFFGNKKIGTTSSAAAAEAAERESTVSVHNPVDLEEAEKLKNAGNAYMQNKEYQKAAEAYTQALKLSPSGPNSHVYFSNRAAALVSMKKFHEAILDSERSLALRPDYGKAHARLGLAHFLLGNYRHAMEAYTVALKYEPENQSSRNYLEKAAKRVAESGEKPSASSPYNLQSSSFSVVSEWEKSNAIKGEEWEAEKFKTKGNSFMSSRDYQLALDSYSRAISISPNGPQTHIYYSNRAAALCYLERYADAERDSLKSLALNPNYGKAHARLGLSRFFLQDYAGSVEAYTAALKQDPDNAASKSYLAKAKAKLQAMAETRRLMDDEGLRRVAEKALRGSPSRESLFEDSDMRSLPNGHWMTPHCWPRCLASENVMMKRKLRELSCDYTTIYIQ